MDKQCYSNTIESSKNNDCFYETIKDESYIQ